MARKKTKRIRGLRCSRRAGSPYYQITGTFRGVTVRQSAGTADFEYAEQLRLEIEKRIMEETLHGAKAVATFGRIANLYLDQRKGSDDRFVKWLIDAFADTKAADITDEAVLKFCRERYPNASPATLNRQVYTPLIAILNAGADATPKLCDVPKFKRPAAVSKVVEYADDEWLGKFLSYRVKTSTDDPNGEKATFALLRLQAIVLLLTTTGCRVAEACRLTWGDLDFKKGTALLARTKNGNPRRLVLGSNVVDALHTLAINSPDAAVPARRVFGFGNRWSVNTALKRACRKMGLKFYSSHKLGRHACAARLLARGHTLGETAKALGWSAKSIGLVHQVYGHLEQSKLDDAVRGAALTVGAPAE